MQTTTGPAVNVGDGRVLLVGRVGIDRAELEASLRRSIGEAVRVRAAADATAVAAVLADDDLPDVVVVADEGPGWLSCGESIDTIRAAAPHVAVVSVPFVGDVPGDGVATGKHHVVALDVVLRVALEQCGHHREAQQREQERRQQCDELKTINRHLEDDLADRDRAVDRRTQQLRMLASELTKAEERERRRLAQMLHDDLQQMLVAARMHISAMCADGPRERLIEMMKHVDDLLDRSIRLSRNLTHRASPPVLYDAGLAPALEWLGRQVSEEHGLDVEVDCDDTAQPESHDTRVLLYQACRELLFNVVKHAGTPRCKLAMHHAGEGDVQVSVCDEGRGFEGGRNREIDASDGFGLFSIRERLELIGGRMEIESITGEGTCVRLYAPIKMSEEERRSAADLGRTLVEALDRDPLPKLPKFTGKPVRVLLADDHRIMRASLAGLLRNQEGIEVVGQAGDGQEVIDQSLQLRPDVIVMDVTMPVIDGVEATRRLTAELPDVFVIALSMHEKEDTQRAMRDAGAKRYLTKDGPPEMLIAAIRSAAQRRGEPRRMSR